MRTNKFLIDGLIGVHVSSIVHEVIRTISIFLQKIFKRTKTLTKPKPTNKIKLSKQKGTKAIIIRAQKRLRGRKLFVLRFGAFFYAQNFFVKNKIVILIASYTILLISKKYVEMTWKFVEISSSTYRRNIHVKSMWIQRGVPVGKHV